MRGLTDIERVILEDCAPGPIDHHRQVTDAEYEVLLPLIARGLVSVRDEQHPELDGEMCDVFELTTTGRLALELDALVRQAFPR